MLIFFVVSLFYIIFASNTQFASNVKQLTIRTLLGEKNSE